MIAAATEEFATVEARFRYRYRSGEPSKDFGRRSRRGRRGTGHHERGRSGQRAERARYPALPLPFHTQRLHTSDILFGHNNIVDISIGDQDEQYLAHIRVFGVTVAKKTLVAE